MSGDTLDAVLEALYASVLDPPQLEAFCAGLAHATGSHVGAVMVQDMLTQGGRLDLLVGADPLEAARYEREFAADNLWLQRGGHRLATGAVLDSDDFVPRRELRDSRYYNEYLRAGDVEQSVALCAYFDGQNVVTATVCRSGTLPPYSPGQMELLRRVSPHWVNAYALQRRLGWLEQRVQHLEDVLEQVPLAVFMLGADGRVLRCNAAAEQLLAAGLLKRTPAGLAATGADAAGFQTLIKAAVTGIPVGGSIKRHQGDGVLRNRAGHAELTVAMHPLAPSQGSMGEAALLFVQPVAAPAHGGLKALLRRAFNLTEAESALCVAFHLTADPAQAALACGISAATVKTRLQSVYDKTGEHGQAPLMRLLGAMARMVPAVAGENRAS